VALPVAPDALAAAIKAAPIVLTGAQGLERAISSAGGLSFEALDGLELKGARGVFVAGEMLDWEAPTGGYLLQASFATGVAAARAVVERLAPTSSPL
jgi:predicted flavoprotein YhiN